MRYPRHEMESPMFEHIVVGVDGRAGGRDALALAALLQHTCGDDLVAVYAYPYDRSVRLDNAGAVETVLRDDLRAKVEGELARMSVAARAMVVADPSPARSLHAIAARQQADLIVVGSAHRAGAERILGGDVTAGTLHGAPCPVAVAPPGFAEGEHALRIVGVGFDGSAESRDALHLAHRVARRADAEVRACIVVPPAVPMWPGAGRDPEWPGYDAAARRASERTLDSALAEIAHEGVGEVIAGQPARELIRRSADLDLLVVGSRSYGPLRRLLLGSTSSRLVRHSSCPVLILPRGAALPGDARRSEDVQVASSP
jgi:nucleotide-binding universal stress UspA family protein